MNLDELDQRIDDLGRRIREHTYRLELALDELRGIRRTYLVMELEAVLAPAGISPA